MVKNNFKSLLMYLIAIAFGVLTFVFAYESDFHFLLVQAQYIFIILLVFSKQKQIFYIVLLLIFGHVVADFLTTESVPIQALTESFVQSSMALILYMLLNQRERQSKRYKNFIEATKIGTWEWNVQTGHCLFNEYWANICGYTLEELKPISIKTWANLAHPEDLKESEEKLNQMFHKETDYYDHQIRMRHKDGHWVWVHDYGKVMSWTEDGKPLIVSGTHINITKEVEMEESITHFQQLMSYIVENANAAVAVHDLDLNYIYVSKKYCDSYHVAYENIIGKHHYEVFPDLPQKWRNVHQRVLKGEVVKADRDPYIHADGRIDYTRWECRPWFDKDQKIGGIIVYTEVINEQIEREIELEKSQAMLQNVMDNLPIGIALTSSSMDSEFDYMNDMFPKIYGVTKESISTKGSFWGAVYEDEKYRKIIKERVLSDVQDHENQNLSWLDIPLKRHNQPTRYVSAYATRVNDSDQLISSVIDVTAQKVREEEIRRIGYTDTLVNLPNRLFFTDQLKSLNQDKTLPVSIIIMDINGLKIINDAFGNEKGNLALKKVGDGLQKIRQDQDFMARIGGDEFAVIIAPSDETKIEYYLRNIQELSNTLAIEDVHYSLAFGVASRSKDTQNMDDVLKIAEEDMYRKKVLEGQSIRNRAILSILSMLTDKYDEERTHSERVSHYCMKIGENLQLNKDELEELKMAGMLHDIGKIAIPDSILDKPGKLTDEEWVIMKQHTLYGYNILKAADEYSNLALYALTHHEKFDGTGYPQGIKGKKIPLYSRIISVVDAYEAMTSDRVYRKAMDSKDAIDELLRWSGKQFDPEIVDIFIHHALNNN